MNVLRHNHEKKLVDDIRETALAELESMNESEGWASVNHSPRWWQLVGRVKLCNDLLGRIGDYDRDTGRKRFSRSSRTSKMDGT